MGILIYKIIFKSSFEGYSRSSAGNSSQLFPLGVPERFILGGFFLGELKVPPRILQNYFFDNIHVFPEGTPGAIHIKLLKAFLEKLFKRSQ